LSWLNFATLWRSRNDTVARVLGDPTDDLRRAWMRAVTRSGGRPAIDHSGAGATSFMLVGDPGEGDASQWATIPALESVWGDTAFMVIMSDVIYPAGCINEYEEKHYRPYRDYPRPIYAIPGNHDWYDDLHGFMYHLCGGVEEHEGYEPTWRRRVPRWKRTLHKRLWRRPEPPVPGIEAMRQTWRPHPAQSSSQRTPYWTIELDHARLVGIDTGIIGGIDREQGDWLRSVSLDPAGADKPKILITGKPLYVDGEYHPGPIEGGGTVDEIVRMPEAGYIAAIGGDIHNYQRYPVKLPDGRTIQYIVAGGGGAFMHPTHTIPRVRLPGVDEDEFRCYPRRGDSLSIFSQLYDRRLAAGRGFLELSPHEASAYMADRLGMRPARDTGEVVVGKRVRWAGDRLVPIPGRWQGPFHPLLALWFDLNTPPMFKSFLRVDAADGRVEIRCHAATGCLEHESDPPLEDSVLATRGPGGWTWTVGPAAAAGPPLPEPALAAR
jgi:hypothetical protein